MMFFFYKWKHIIKYFIDKKEDINKRSRKTAIIKIKEKIILNIRSYWLEEESTSIFNDLSLNYEVLNRNIKKIF